MPTIRRVFLFFLMMMFLGSGKVFAGCNVGVSPSNVVMGGSNTSSFSVTNTGEAMVNWVRIQSPGLTAFSIAQMSAGGWYPNGGGDTANFAGGYLEGGTSANFDLTLTESGETISNMTWEALVSTDGGENFESCGSVNIQVDQRITPTISNASLTIGSNSVVVSWNTNVSATGVVSYGTSASYGSNKTTASGTTHSVTINDLSPSTTYHYQIQVTSDGGTVSGSDATFTTAAAGAVQTVTSTVTVNTTTTTTTTNLVTKILKDIVPPKVSLKTDFDKNFEEAPTIIGRVTDSGEVNVGVMSVDYSIDGGKNWLPVETDGSGKKTIDFEFTPMTLDDGNYSVKVRSRDMSGNVGVSKSYKMIIDRLPPQVGGSLWSVGSMILDPDMQGNIYVTAGTEVKVVLGSVGGATNINLLVGSNKTELIKNNENGLWSGIVKIENEGTFEVIAQSVDGANNKTERKLNKIVSQSLGRVFDKDKKIIDKAKIKIYTYKKETNNFELWQAEPFEQINPIMSQDDGEYRLILPSGKYFLEIEKKGKTRLRSEIFEINKTTQVRQDFFMSEAKWWNWMAESVAINIEEVEEKNNDFMTDKTMPDFEFEYEDKTFDNSSILGKTTWLTFVSSWNPKTSDQLLELEKLKENYPEINVVAVTIQDNKSKTDILKKNGNYKIPIVADSDGKLVEKFNLGSLPTHVILNRKGIIKSVIVGFMDNKDLVKRIIN